MKKVLLSAYACDPSKGSEPGYGFSWAEQLAMSGYQVYCVTTSKGKSAIEQEVGNAQNPKFIYVDLPFGLDKIYYKSQMGMYLHYLLWQWKAWRVSKREHKKIKFDVAHHVTWGSIQQGSFLYKLKIPFVFGPAGGGQNSPEALKRFYLDAWKGEKKREYVAKKLTQWNPACHKMIKKAKVILASNMDTKNLADKLGSKKVDLVLDIGLPKSFYPKELPSRQFGANELKLLWIGRFMPRKGLILLLEVMKELKDDAGIVLTIVGDGEMKQEVLNGIAKYGLTNVNCVGKVPFSQVAEYYVSHDLLVFPSLRDSVGVQLIEAMAYGLPIITLDLNGASILITKETGVKVPVKQEEQVIMDFAQAVRELRNDAPRLERMSESAFATSKNFIWEDKIKHIAKTYYPSI